MQEVKILGIISHVFDRAANIGNGLFANQLAKAELEAKAKAEAKVKADAKAKADALLKLYAAQKAVRAKAKADAKAKAEAVRAERAAVKAEAHKGYEPARAGLLLALGLLKGADVKKALVLIRGGEKALQLLNDVITENGVPNSRELSAEKRAAALKCGVLRRTFSVGAASVDDPAFTLNSLGANKRGTKVATHSQALDFDKVNNQQGTQLVPEMVVLPTGVKSETRILGYTNESESDLTVGVINKLNSSWNSSLFNLCLTFGIPLDAKKDVLKVTAKDLGEDAKSSLNRSLFELDFLPITEGIYLRKEVWVKVVGEFAKVFGDLKDLRSYGKSFITTPALQAFKEFNNLPVFLAGDDLLPWEGNDGAGLVTAGTIMPEGFQFRYLGNGRFGKGLMARSHYLVKEEDGVFSLEGYKGMHPSTFLSLQKWLKDVSGYSFKVGNATYWKAAILTPSTLKGLNKKIPKGGVFLKDGGLFTIIGKDSEKMKTSNNWQISQLLQALGNPSKNQEFLKAKEEFLGLLDSHMESSISKLVNKVDRNGNLDFIQLANVFNSEKYAHLLNTFNTKAESRYVNMMTFGSAGVVIKAFSKKNADKLVMESVVTRTPNQDSQSVQVIEKINPAKLYDLLKESRGRGWANDSHFTEEEQRVLSKVLGTWQIEECERFFTFFANVISPQVASGVTWVSTELQGLITGDNDGDRDIITDEALWLAMGKLIAFNKDLRPVKESLKAFVLEASVIPSLEKLKTNDNELLALINMVSKGWTEELGVALSYITAKNSGQLNVGAITNGAAIATTWFQPVFFEDGSFRMKHWVRQYFFACFDVQQVSIDRQKYAYVIPSLRYFHLSKGAYKLKNGTQLLIPGLSFVPAGMSKLIEVNEQLNDVAAAEGFFKTHFSGFKDGVEHMPDLELGTDVQITDPVQGYSVLGVYTWAQFVLMCFKLCEALEIEEEKWGEVYAKLLTSKNFVQFFNDEEDVDRVSAGTGLITELGDLVRSGKPAEALAGLKLIKKAEMLAWLDDANAEYRPEHMEIIKARIDAMALSSLDKLGVKASSVEGLEDAFMQAMHRYSDLLCITNHSGDDISPDAHMAVFVDAMAKSKELEAREAEALAQSVRKQASSDSSTKILSRVAGAFGEAWYLGEEKVTEERMVMQSFCDGVRKALLNSQVNSDARKGYLNRFEEAVQKTASIVVANDSKYDKELIPFLGDCMAAISEARTNTARLDFHGENLRVELIKFFQGMDANKELKPQINALYNKVFKNGVDALWDGLEEAQKQQLAKKLGVDDASLLSFDQKLYLARFTGEWSFFENSLSIVNRLHKAVDFYGSTQMDKIKATVLKSIKSFDRSTSSWADELVVAPVADFQMPLEFWADKLVALIGSGLNINLKLKKAKGLRGVDGGYQLIKADAWVMYSSVMLNYLQVKGVDLKKYLLADLEIGLGQVWSLADYLSLLGDIGEGGVLGGHSNSEDEAILAEVFTKAKLDLDEYRKALNLLKAASFKLSAEWQQVGKTKTTLVANTIYVGFAFMLVNSLVKKHRRESNFDSDTHNYTSALRVSLHNALGVEMAFPESSSKPDFSRLLDTLWPSEVQEVLQHSGFGRISFNGEYSREDIVHGGYAVHSPRAPKFGKVKTEKTAYQKLKESRPSLEGGLKVHYQQEHALPDLFVALAEQVKQSNSVRRVNSNGMISLLGVMLLQSDFVMLAEIALGLREFEGSDKLLDPCYYSLYKKISNKDFRSMLGLIKHGQQGNRQLSQFNLDVNIDVEAEDLVKSFK